MIIKYACSVVSTDASVVKQLQLENDPILLMQYIKEFLNDRMKQSKLKTAADLRVIDVRSVYKPIEEKFYFYVTSAYSIEEGSENNDN